MKKKFILFLISVVIMYPLHSQSFIWIYDEAKEYDIPIGKGLYDELHQGAFYPEMEEYYDHYTINETVIQQLNQKLKNIAPQDSIEIDIYFGAWCGDSKEHLPAFMKIVDALSAIDEKNIVLIGCDRDKNAGCLDISEVQIELVPTFIFLINGTIIGKIIETPEQSLEEDFLLILQNFEK